MKNIFMFQKNIFCLKNISFTNFLNRKFSTKQNFNSSSNDKLNISAITINNKNEISNLIKHMDNLNLPKDKPVKKEDLEYLFKNFSNNIKQENLNVLTDNQNNEKDKIVSLQYLLINYDNYSKYLELSKPHINQNIVKKNNINNSNKKIEIIKKDDKFIINLNDLADKNVYLGVIVNKRIRFENPDKVNNIIFFISL